MRIVIVADTHGDHAALGTLEGDVLIHCGDVETVFKPNAQAVRSIDDWFGAQRFDQIFCVGGNHDFELERLIQVDDEPFANATWLHEKAVTYRGVTFYGASWVPDLSGFAFYAGADELRAGWARIPDNVDVLVTHTPPHGTLDVSSGGLVLGCPYLAQRLEGLSPKLHCFGHVHRSSGTRRIGATTYVNAAVVNSRFEVVRKPVVFDL